MKTQLTQDVLKAKAYYLSIPKEEKEKKVVARQNWSELSIKEVDQVSTLAGAMEVFKRAPWGMPAKQIALAKWAELCMTIAEIKIAYKSSCRRIKWLEDNAALQKWEAMSCIDAHTASTIAEARLAYTDSPWGWAIWYEDGEITSMSRAYLKWLGLCSTLKELKQLEIITGHGYEDTEVYRKKYDELHLKEKGWTPVYHQMWAMG